MYRQGDLLFIKVDTAPRGIMKESKVVLGSSVTGHDHAITEGKVYENNPSWEDKANFYVEIPEGGADLVHPEHKTIPLEEGVYQVIRQREVHGYVRD